MVQLTVKIPETVASALGATSELAARAVLELAAIEAYRSGKLSRGQVRQMLQLGWHENEEFLASQGCFRDYSIEDLEEDRKSLAKLLGQ
jgi:predicted HTH domain antitoxin